MKLLLDAHVLLWHFSGDPRLSPRCQAVLDDDGNSKWVSIASLWEIVIKVGLGITQLGQPFDQLFPTLLRKNQIDVLTISTGHVSRLLTLPGIHSNPIQRRTVGPTS